MPSSVGQRVTRYRASLRRAGLRPVQLWVPDTRRAGFDEECRRQAAIAAATDAADPGLDTFMDAAAVDAFTGSEG